MSRGLAPLIITPLPLAFIAALGFIDGFAPAPPALSPPAVAAVAAPVAAALVPVDDLLPAGLPPPPPKLAPPPPSKSAAFPQMPVDASVAVFVPTRPGVGQTRMAIPNASAGYSSSTTLTFDDCGEPGNIGGVVDALARSHRQALFFITGQCRDHYPWLVAELKAAGHQVCNHTYSHPDLRRLGDAAIRAEIASGVMAGCPYFRPPYGAWDGPRGRIARIAAEFGLAVMLWDVDTRDWADADPAAMVAVIRARGGVVLFHLHGVRTLEALTALDS